MTNKPKKIQSESQIIGKMWKKSTRGWFIPTRMSKREKKTTANIDDDNEKLESSFVVNILKWLSP